MLLKVWFRKWVAEIQDHMQSWHNQGIMVDDLHHWPGDLNIAHRPARARPTSKTSVLTLSGNRVPM